MGDHDVHQDRGAGLFRALVGDPTGVLCLGGFRFVRLNTQEGRPVGLSASQLAWFRTQVEEARPAGQRVVVFQHNYPFQIWEDFAGPGIDCWREVVQTRRVMAIFTGHTHYLQTANDGRNVVVATRSIGDPEGGWPGFLVVYLHEDDLAFTYRTVEDHGPVVLITHPREKLLATGPAHIIRGADQVRARVWTALPLTEVKGRLDGGLWFPLEPCGPQDWISMLAGDKLEKGEHSLEVRAVDEARQSGGHTIEFAADATGRFTAVPSVRLLVTRTQFC